MLVDNRRLIRNMLEEILPKDEVGDGFFKFEALVRDIFYKLCKSYENWGYEYFYEISDEDLEDMCEANGYEFLADGTVF